MSCASFMRVTSSPPMWTVPSVGRSSPASRCISVDLPEPDGPMIAVNWPCGHVERDAAQRVDRRVALAVGARDGAGGDGGCGGLGRAGGGGGVEHFGFSWCGGGSCGEAGLTAVTLRPMRSSAVCSAPALSSAEVASARIRPRNPRPGLTPIGRADLAAARRQPRGRSGRRRRRARPRAARGRPRRPRAPRRRSPPRRRRGGPRRAGGCPAPGGRVARSETSKSTGAHDAIASGSVSASSTASGGASTVVVAVQVLMTLPTLPAPAPPCRRPR